MCDLPDPADPPPFRGLGALYGAGRTATREELVRYAEGQGWSLRRSPNGPVKYVDDDGQARLTIKSGSPRTSGSEGPHVEIRDGFGRRVDPFGSPVSRRAPDNHYPFRP